MSVILKKMQVKTLRYPLTPVRMTVIKKIRNNKCWQGCEEKATLVCYGGKYKSMQPLCKIVWVFLKNLKIELPYNPAIPLLGVYLKKTKTLTPNICAFSVLISALLTVAKIQNSLTVHQLISGYRKYDAYIFFNNKNEGDLAICDLMDGPLRHYAK